MTGPSPWQSAVLQATSTAVFAAVHPDPVAAAVITLTADRTVRHVSLATGAEVAASRDPTGRGDATCCALVTPAPYALDSAALGAVPARGVFGTAAGQVVLFADDEHLCRWTMPDDEPVAQVAVAAVSLEHPGRAEERTRGYAVSLVALGVKGSVVALDRRADGTRHVRGVVPSPVLFGKVTCVAGCGEGVWYRGGHGRSGTLHCCQVGGGGWQADAPAHLPSGLFSGAASHLAGCGGVLLATRRDRLWTVDFRRSSHCSLLLELPADACALDYCPDVDAAVVACTNGEVLLVSLPLRAAVGRSCVHGSAAATAVRYDWAHNLVVATVAGQVELLRPPAEVRAMLSAPLAAAQPSDTFLAQGRVLRQLVALEAFGGGAGAGVVAESVIAARRLVPEEAQRYCGQSLLVV